MVRRAQRQADDSRSRLVRLSTMFIAAMVLGGSLLLVLAAHAAELDSRVAMTADHGPGFRVQECRPGESCRWRGRVFDNLTGCQVDLWSVANAAPKGTRTSCPKVDSKHKVNDR